MSGRSLPVSGECLGPSQNHPAIEFAGPRSFKPTAVRGSHKPVAICGSLPHTGSSWCGKPAGSSCGKPAGLCTLKPPLTQARCQPPLTQAHRRPQPIESTMLCLRLQSAVPPPRKRYVVPAPPEPAPRPVLPERPQVSTPPERPQVSMPTERPQVSAPPKHPQVPAPPERPQVPVPSIHQPDRAPTLPNKLFWGIVVGLQPERPGWGLGPRPRRRSSHVLPNPRLCHGHPSSLLRHGRRVSCPPWPPELSAPLRVPEGSRAPP